MRTLADFLNHGTLPFVGREAEIARITGFWRGTFDATALRAMLVVGEAGIGKSRLLEHAMRGVVDAGGSVVHVKLYPESTAPFMSLAARALWHPDAGRSTLGGEPEAKLGAVTAAMRRLARLRPTLFVLEDLHLLGGDALPALAGLLDAMADETISVLAAARPVDLEARGTLEAYLIDEFVLPGLERAACARVWEELWGSAAGPDIASALLDATAGNPLALRSALRGVLRGADGSDRGSPAMLRGPDGARTLARTIKRSVGLLADGMIGHLSREEIAAARRLAVLGEVFAREAAAAVLGDAGGAVETLLFKGIIATAVAAPAALPGESGAHQPLGFTHTLLHRQLIDGHASDPGSILHIVAGHPLYSILPFRLLAARPFAAPELDTATIARAFERTIKVQIALNQGAGWRDSRHTWKAAAHMVMSRLGRWDRADWERMLIKLINHKLNMVRREPAAVRERWLTHLDAVTANPTTDELSIGRLYVLFNRELLYSLTDPAITDETWKQAEALLQDRGHLRHTLAYAGYVVAACVGAQSNDRTDLLRRIDRRVDSLLASGDLPDDVRRAFELKVRPPLLCLFENEDELRVRMEHVEEFSRTVAKSDTSVWKFCINLLAEIGAVDALESACESTLTPMREQGMFALIADAAAKLGCVLAGVGRAVPATFAAFEIALDDIAAWRRAEVEGYLAGPLLNAALMLNDGEEARRIARGHRIADADLYPAQWIALALAEPDPVAALDATVARGCDGGRLAILLNRIRSGAPIDADDVRASLPPAPVLRLSDVLEIEAALGLIGLACGADAARSAAAAPARDAAVRALEWLASPPRRMFAYMRALLDRAAPHLSGREAASWKRRVDDLAGQSAKAQAAAADSRIRLSMLGTVQALTPDGRVQRFQGARARMVLAMMVINETLDKPMSQAEFCRLAAGGEVVEIESARDIVKTTVHRIRELIGRDAVLTEGAAPRLNPELVEIDIVEARALLDRSAEAMRRSSPMQAKGALTSALDIMRGEVPFPSLYDDVIEAAREDIETLLRSTVIDVARALAREGAIDDAAEVLRRSVDAIPGDEEIKELLRETLLRGGRRAEAERIRRMVESE